MKMMLSARTKRMGYILGVALLAASQLPVLGEMLDGIVGYEVMGFSLMTIVAALVLYGTYLLYKRRLG